MMRLPVLVISLPRSVERRTALVAALSRLGIASEVFEAADGERLVRERDVPWSDAATLEVHPLLGRRLTDGEIGCAVSHLTLWHRIATSLPGAIVLEDDCHLTPGFAEVLAGVQEAAGTWDLVLLGHRSTRRDEEAGATAGLGGRALGTAHRLARLVEFATGTHAYAVSARGAERLARFAEPIRMPADWVTGYAPAAGVRLHGVTPPCAIPDTRLESTIPGRDVAHARLAAAHDSALRTWAGRAWLAARQLGVYPGGYTWPYSVALQPRRGRTTSA